MLTKLTKYYLSGLTCFGIDFLVTGMGIFLLELPEYVSHSIGWLVASGCNFQLNRIWVFEDRSKVRWKFKAFVVLALFALVGGTALLWLLNQIAGLNFYFAKLSAMLAMSFVNYMVVSKVIFANRRLADFKDMY
ncbi:GtrA family protein [Parapedobacter sp. GCM10030251]|uniref:GtrA family protein n=1 Tax=Parapedobacter sp. GCM10030251 TaxID=3273419 RepID=UPI00361EBF7B